MTQISTDQKNAEAHAKFEAEWSQDRPAFLESISECFATHGTVGICIGGKLWRFTAVQPGHVQASEYGTADGQRCDHAKAGIDVPDVMAALS